MSTGTLGFFSTYLLYPFVFNKSITLLHIKYNKKELIYA